MTERRDTRFFLDDYVLTLNQSLAFLFTQIRKNLLAFLLIIIACTAAGFAYWYTRTPVYESELVVAYNNERFSRKTFGEMTQKLNVLAHNGSHNQLAQLLHLTPEQSARITSIEARNKVGSPLHEDITGDYQPLYITLTATDKSVFKPVQDALVDYLGNTPYQREIGAIQVEKITQKLIYLLGDIQKVDSMLDAYTVAVRAGLVFRDTVANSSDLTDMLNYKNQLEDHVTHHQQRRALESGPTIMVMHGFTPSDHPSRGSKKVIAACAIIGLLLAMGWAVLKNNTPAIHA